MKLARLMSGVAGSQIRHTLPLLWLLILLFVLVSTVFAHGEIDIDNMPETDAGTTCNDVEFQTLSQSFTTTDDTIVGVDVGIFVADNLPVEGASIPLYLRHEGFLMTTASIDVEVPGYQVLHVDFITAFIVFPGVYEIELDVFPILNWDVSWATSYDDPYPGGTAYDCFGQPMAGADFNFRVYTQAAAPEANDDEASAIHNTPTVIDVAANDFDPNDDLDVSTVTLISTPDNGSAVANGDGTVTYTSIPGFNGVDTFMYEICDVWGFCDTAMVSVDVSVGGGPDPGDNPGNPGGPDNPGDDVPDNPSNAGGNANPNACNNPGVGNHPANIPPCSP